MRSIFGSTFFELVSHFMFMPMLLLRMKGADVSTTVAGLFASVIAHRVGRRQAMWGAAAVLTLCALLFALTTQLWLWFVLNMVSGVAMALRWVLAEALMMPAGLLADRCKDQAQGRCTLMVACAAINLAATCALPRGLSRRADCGGCYGVGGVGAVDGLSG